MQSQLNTSLIGFILLSFLLQSHAQRHERGDGSINLFVLASLQRLAVVHVVTIQNAVVEAVVIDWILVE